MSRKPLFLVVDDEPVTRLMLCRFLERQGYETETAENGQQALNRFEAQQPDIILMDAKMPVLDGFEACSELKKRPDARHVPVLMITGLNDDESVDRAYEAGAADFITKPIHWAILRNRVQYLLRAIEADRQLHLSSQVFENTTEGIVITDAKACIQSVNPAFSVITGYQPEEIVGQNMRILKSGHHDEKFYHNLWKGIKENGQWKGEIWNRRKNGEIYPEWATINSIKAPDNTVSNYVAVFSDLTTVKESEQNILYLAGHDTLTDLPNRLLFTERLSQAVADAERKEEIVGSLLLDLDRFKVINDTMGHDVGDTVLLEASKRLRECVPINATLSRMGGDEFGMVVPNPPGSRDMAHIAQKVLDVLAAPFIIDGMELFVGGSIGLGLYPLDGEDVKTLIKNTDAAMYHAKELGRNNFQFYRMELNASSLARMLLESSLRNALDRDEFELYYQPQMDLGSGKMIGMEALIRWNHPDQGMVSPGDFIPLAEETGLIVPIGQWALKEACSQNKAWIDQGLPPLRVAVNLSGIQFQQADFVDVVAQVVNETGLDHQYLELELTESIAMGDVEETLSKLQALSDMGMKLAIDDFGTGFSSLSYLKRFPIHTLKIDQSFVRNCTTDPDDAAIIRTFVGLAHSLNLSVIAEGVETEQQLAFLKERECNEIQGYFYGRPLPAEAFVTFVQGQIES
ncbi:MAG: EAL domain-containing protein [Magnetococcales bacterium]|nr:EAL domain-containing protein [Magnetococcales bacterium]